MCMMWCPDPLPELLAFRDGILEDIIDQTNNSWSNVISSQWLHSATVFGSGYGPYVRQRAYTILT